MKHDLDLDISTGDKWKENILSDDTVEMDFSGILSREEAALMYEGPANRRQINAYTLEGEFIESYDSITEAAKAVGTTTSTVVCVCKGKALHSPMYNRIWLYREEDIEKRLQMIEEREDAKIVKKQPNNVYEYALNGKLLFVYPTSKEAALVNKVSPTKISFCCTGRILHIGNRIFLRHDGNIEKRLALVKEKLKRKSQKRHKEDFRPVDVYTLDGKYIKGFPSCASAAREYGEHVGSVWYCCKGLDSSKKHTFTLHGRIFLFTGDSISNRLDLIKLKNKRT